MKTFNTAGTCRPNEHYMVDITERLEIISKMIAKGDAYNERGEEQLCHYLEYFDDAQHRYFDLQTGYLLSFCFNKTKKPGLLPAVELKGRTLIEAIV